MQRVKEKLASCRLGKTDVGARCRRGGWRLEREGGRKTSWRRWDLSRVVKIVEELD